MHTLPRQTPLQPLAASNPGFPNLQGTPDGARGSEPALSGSPALMPGSSSGMAARGHVQEVPLAQIEPVPNIGHADHSRKPAIHGHEQQSVPVISVRAGQFPPGAVPEAGQPYIQAQSSGSVTPRPLGTPLAQSAGFYHTPSMAHYSSVGVQGTPPQPSNYSQGQLASTAQAPSYAVRPPYQDQLANGDLAPQPAPGHQVSPYQRRAGDETASLPPEQQYEDYMHNPGSLGLAAALYHDTQSQPSMMPSHQSVELMTPQPSRSSETPPHASEASQAAAYAAYNPYEQHGLVPTQGYYPSDVHLLQLQGAPLAPLSSGMSTVPGFALVHPGGVGQQPMLAPPASAQAQAQAQAQAPLYAQRYDVMTSRHVNDQKKTIRGRSRSNMRFHECSVCRKRFGRPSALQTHVYSHTGEKPYKCDLDDCTRCFSVLSNLRRHQRVHHGPGASGCPTHPTHSSYPPQHDLQDEKKF